MKLSDMQKNFLQLLLRSPDTGDGWRSLSKPLNPLAKMAINENPELYETTEDGGVIVSIRLSSRGIVLANYI